MNEYLNKRTEQFIARSTKQIEAYKKLLDVLEQSRAIFKTFDGKVINKRIETKLTNELSDGGRFTFRVWKEYNSFCFLIRLTPFDEIHYKSPSGGSMAIENNSVCVYSIKTAEGRLQANGNNHLDYASTEKEFDITLNGINNRIETLEQCLENTQAYIEEGEKIKQAIEDYQKRIPHPLRLTINVGNYDRL